MPRRIDAFAVDQHVTLLVAFRDEMDGVVDGIGESSEVDALWISY